MKNENEIKINENYKECLHCLVKEISQQREHKLKVICDWDEVTQPRTSYLHYQNSQINSPSDLSFSSEHLEAFWKKKLVEFNSHSCYFVEESLREEIAKVKDKSDSYAKSPFLSPANELLLALKEGLVEKLIFLSAYNQDNLTHRMTHGDQRKINKFQATFGHFPQCKFEPFPFSPQKGTNFFKWQAIQQYNPDFDLFIDDNPNIIKGAQENLPADKFFALPDYYEHNRNVQGSNIYHFKIGVSSLQEDDFVKLAQEWQERGIEMSSSQLESYQVQLTKESLHLKKY